MLNNIVIMGRFVRDPELRYTQNDKPVCNFTLAVPRDIDREQTDFIDCVAWNKTAEFVCNYFQKGKLTCVNGRLQIRDWTDRDGNKRTSAEVLADHVYFAGGKDG